MLSSLHLCYEEAWLRSTEVNIGLPQPLKILPFKVFSSTNSSQCLKYKGKTVEGSQGLSTKPLWRDNQKRKVLVPTYCSYCRLTSFGSLWSLLLQEFAALFL